jgi:hypothetical protein
MKTKNVFEGVDRPRIQRSALDLSHEYKTTHDMFDLIPISVVECIPGDVHKIGVSAVVRFQPMLAPILHRVKMRFMSFFVPFRLVWDQWETFITRNPDGDTVVAPPKFDPGDYGTPANVYAQGTLWDYFGYPLLRPPTQACPLDFPRRAYFKIWNDFFRDENLEDEIDYEDPASNAFGVLRSAWSRDLFTSSLPFRQKGTSPALPVFGSTSATFSLPGVNLDGVAAADMRWVGVRPSSDGVSFGANLGSSFTNVTGAPTALAAQLSDTLSDHNTIDGGTLSAADIADLRLAWQVQAWMERNARGGTRYVEFLWSQFNIAPRDETLQRPVFIGAVTSDVLVSEVLQTSSSDAQPTVQGNMAGHGVGLAKGMIGSYRVKEFGVMMTLATVIPAPAYQQGIDRSWLRRTSFDYPFPLFTGLSEQEVYNAEIYTRDSTADPSGAINLTPFGYTGRYNELRFVPNRVTNEMRDTFDYWHLGRKFAAAPSLNADFVRPNDAEISELKRIFAVQNVPGLLCSYGIRLQSYRPIPYMAVPSNLGGI